MTDLETLTTRNQSFAASYSNDLNIMPRFSTIILTCIDARVNPAQVLGLELGEALVIRNAGGRVNDDVVLELGILSAMAKKLLGEAFQGFTLAIIQHTDCGMEKLANPEMVSGLSQGLGVEQSRLESLAIEDHEKSIKDDITHLKNNSVVPQNLKVASYVLDVSTGLLNEVLPEQPLSQYA